PRSRVPSYGLECHPDAVAVVAAVMALAAPVVAVAVAARPVVGVEDDADAERIVDAVLHAPAFAGAVAGHVGRCGGRQRARGEHGGDGALGERGFEEGHAFLLLASAPNGGGERAV